MTVLLNLPWFLLYEMKIWCYLILFEPILGLTILRKPDFLKAAWRITGAGFKPGHIRSGIHQDVRFFLGVFAEADNVLLTRNYMVMFSLFRFPDAVLTV